MRRWVRVLLLVLLLLLLLAAAAVWFWPPPGPQTAAMETALDQAMPVYHHREIHEIQACGDPGAIDRALREVRAAEIQGFLFLIQLRQLRGRPHQDAASLPLLEVMRRANFVALADQPGQEIVYATAGPFWTLRGARGAQYVEIRKQLRAAEGSPARFAAFEVEGAAKAAINFRLVHAVGEECPRLITETRVWCGDPAGLRSFTRYWRVIQPGSALLRRNWLAAVVRRAGAPQH
jgi:hypothetical protein